MSHFKNSLTAYGLGLLASLFWFFKYHTSDVELSFIASTIVVVKTSLIFFLVFFVIYFGYNFVLRASKTYGETGMGLEKEKEKDANSK